MEHDIFYTAIIKFPLLIGGILVVLCKAVSKFTKQALKIRFLVSVSVQAIQKVCLLFPSPNCRRKRRIAREEVEAASGKLAKIPTNPKDHSLLTSSGSTRLERALRKSSQASLSLTCPRKLGRDGRRSRTKL